MNMEHFSGFTYLVVEILVNLLIFVVGVVLLVAAIYYLVDRIQTTHTIRRNYPLIGRFRYLLEHLGKFFRQYFFALDREEMPFNRAQRGWVYRAAKNRGDTVAFGSTKNLRTPGTVLFVNDAFPILEEEAGEPVEMLFGPHCREPYRTRSYFNISGMSFGAISRPAVRALSAGAKRAGCWLNTGEGGLSPWHLEGGCDLVLQIGTAKYGVRDDKGELDDAKLIAVSANKQVRMVELKLSQGAKPGKGGILPANKVTEEIAAIRGIPAGKASVSPNRHPELKTPGDILDMIGHVRELTGKPAGFKTVLGDTGWLETMLSEVLRRGLESAPDFITLDSADGGSGAAPMSLMDQSGLPISESLPMLVDLVEGYGLKERIRIIASGKLINPADVAWALCMGADAVVSARGFMFALGCIQAMQCNRNTCPTGVTTHDKRLQRGLVPEEKSVRVSQFHRNLCHEVETIAHSCGVREPHELRREHVRLVVSHGRSVPYSELYPPGGEWRPPDTGRMSGTAG